MRLNHLTATLKRVEQFHTTQALDWDITPGPLGKLIATADCGQGHRLVVHISAAAAVVHKQHIAGRRFTTVATDTLAPTA